MPKAQVLVTITAEALVDVPAEVHDIEGYIRQNIGLAWGGLELASVVQTPGIKLDYFVVPEPEPEPVQEPDALVGEEIAADEYADVSAESEPVPTFTAEPSEAAAAGGEAVADVLARFDDPVFADLVRSAIRTRASQLIEEVVQQVVSELEPLLQRHLARNPDGNK